MLVKVIKSYRDVVAICDAELLGKHFEEGNRILNIKESFYDGEEKTPKETTEIIQNMALEDATFNIVGEKSVECAKKCGLITEDAIKKVEGIPFALVLI